MKILYIILTCEKYRNRMQWQKSTWLKNVNESDYIYLEEPVGEETYNNAPKKYVQFFSSFERILEYDWVFFCDDDTFVFTDRLKHFLTPIDRTPKMIGYILGDFDVEKFRTTLCSGGAGIAVTSNLVQAAKEYLAKGNFSITHETDVSLTIWCKVAVPEMVVMDASDFFRPHNPRSEYNKKTLVENAITYHYCTAEDFNFLNK